MRGVDVDVATRGLRVGRTGALVITAAAPSGTVLDIEQGLPAGAKVGAAAAALAQRQGGELEVFADRIRLRTRAFGAGEVLDLEIPVDMAFEGRFQTTPMQVSVDGGPQVAMRPHVWSVGG